MWRNCALSARIPLVVPLVSSFRYVSNGGGRAWAPSEEHPDEKSKWWPQERPSLGTQMHRQTHDASRTLNDGMTVPRAQMPQQGADPQLSFEGDFPLLSAKICSPDQIFGEEKRWLPPPTFDPALDDVDEEMTVDGKLLGEVSAAVESDRRRLEAFSNPVSVADQVDFMLDTQRKEKESMLQRQEFNGFSHWGLLHGAHIALEEQSDFKKAHQFVNRYMRDIDLFAGWLKHPKVKDHIQKKFGVDISDKFDKLMGLSMAMYTRAKIQAFEGDPPGALKSLTACTTLIHDGGDLDNARHRKMLGAALAARGMIFCKMGSFERCEDDLTRALNFVPVNRCASLFQLRAEAREKMGRIEEARADEERAADIWEEADVISAGIDGEPTKFVI